MRRRVRNVCGVVAAACSVLLPAVGTSPVPALAATTVIACPHAAYGVRYYAPGAGKTVALTFDDGPGRSTTPILRELAREHVEATFFNLGLYEAQSPKKVRTEDHTGFALGDHTWDHPDLTLMSRKQQAREIDRERRKQASITGAYPCMLRPPYGNYNSATLRLAQRRGMRVWYWSVDTEDWKASGSDDASWIKRIVARAEAGGTMRHPVILMHNQIGGNPATVDALPTIIKYYKSHGYRFVDLYGRTGHPVIRHISPAAGPAAGGTRVTITGHDFRGVRRVVFGRSAGTKLQVESGRKLLVTSPRHAAGRVHLRIVTTFGTSPKRARDMFRFRAA